jgi:uncharacterized protein (DUF1501 family)
MCKSQLSHSAVSLSRRSAIAWGALAALSGTRAFAQAPTAAQNSRLVVVFLRGAVDGLSLFVPYGDSDYYSIRPNIAIPRPDGTAKTAIALDQHWGLHPSLAPLLPEWQRGSLAVVPAAGLPKPNRSHFDAQFQMETGSTGKVSGVPGWLNAALATQQRSREALALGVGEANPPILSGTANVKLIPRGQAAQRSGVLANERTRSALLDMYKNEGQLGQAFAKGSESRLQSAGELTAARQQRMAAASAAAANIANPSMSGMTGGRDYAREMVAASNGAADPVGLALDAQHLATLMNSEPQLRVGFLSAGGWDTHANQGSVAGALANNLSGLANGLVSLRQQFNRPGDLVIVMSEFGRTSAENGTRGTDHGFGNALWLIGDRANGGKMHGEFTGLAKANLNEGRDLPAHHDYRAVLAQVFKRQLAMSDAQLADVLPGASWDARLDGLLRSA